MTTPTPYVLTLPLTDEQIEIVARALCGKDADEMTHMTLEPGVTVPHGPRWTHFIDDARNAVDAIRAIATPADATLRVVGFHARLANAKNSRTGEWCDFDEKPRYTDNGYVVPEGAMKDYAELVRLTDAQAAIAAAGAENARLREALLRLLMWARPIAGDNRDFDAVREEEESITQADIALAASSSGAGQ